MRRAALLVACGAVLAVPGLAQAKTRSVHMGVPVNSQKAFQSSGAEVNDFFPHSTTINAGDSVRFLPAGFHTLDIPPKGDAPLPLFSPTGQKIAGVNDATGAPFWFNGQDALSFTPDLLRSAFGKRLTYRGTSRVESGAPLGENLKPLTVKFPKAGTYRYYCDVHAGMTGTVKVKGRGARVPSGKRHARALEAQVARDLERAKTLAATKPPANTVYTGASAPGGVEFLGMQPASLTVPAGTAVRFQMSPGSYDVHTATFGPGDPVKDPGSYLGQIAATFQGASPDPKGLYPSELPGTTPAALTPALHGNGFWSSGAMDGAAATPLPSFDAVTFGAPGTYDFYCMIHPFMHGTVVVR